MNQEHGEREQEIRAQAGHPIKVEYTGWTQCGAEGRAQLTEGPFLRSVLTLGVQKKILCSTGNRQSDANANKQQPAGALALPLTPLKSRIPGSCAGDLWRLVVPAATAA